MNSEVAKMIHLHKIYTVHSSGNWAALTPTGIKIMFGPFSTPKRDRRNAAGEETPTLRLGNEPHIALHKRFWRAWQWQGKSLGSKGWWLAAAIPIGVFLVIRVAYAKPLDKQDGDLTIASFREVFAPLVDAVSYVAYLFAFVFNYIMTHDSAAIIISALSAYYAAVIGIREQRRISRLNETFVTLDRGNRDEDLIKARTEFAKLRIKLKDSKETIAKFAKPAEEETELAGDLSTLLNYCENIALAVRMGVLDENYLYRWMRGLLISDWDGLSPLVTAIRHERSSPFLYIEFEGLASCWQQDISYSSGKSLCRAGRNISVS